jgi:hypothetical protein
VENAKVLKIDIYAICNACIFSLKNATIMQMHISGHYNNYAKCHITKVHKIYVIMWLSSGDSTYKISFFYHSFMIFN